MSPGNIEISHGLQYPGNQEPTNTPKRYNPLYNYHYLITNSIKREMRGNIIHAAHGVIQGETAGRNIQSYILQTNNG